MSEGSAGSVPGADLYNLACVAALAAAAARTDPTLAESTRASRSESFGETAMSYLNRAEAVGFFRNPANAAHFHKDSDLDSLRDRDDFRRFASAIGRP